MNFKIKLLIIFLLGFIPVLLFLISSPILQQQYLINCQGTTEKIFMGCDVNQSSWHWKVDRILYFLAIWGSPLIIGFLTVLMVRKNKKRGVFYIFLPAIMLILLVILAFFIDLISGEQIDYPPLLLFTSLLIFLITLIVNLSFH